MRRLLADGEHVVDVPAKLAARARLFDTGHNRKTAAHDAVAVVAVRTGSPVDGYGLVASPSWVSNSSWSL